MGQNSSLIKKAMKSPENEQMIKKIFEKYDKDKSGALSKEEFIPFVKDVEKSLGISFVTHTDSLFTFLLNFDEVDSDKNGNIDFGELKVALQKVKNENCSEFSYDEFEMKKLQVVGFISKFKSVYF
jgi:Ca2+-binding EF-hand superfamily protein